VTAING